MAVRPLAFGIRMRDKSRTVRVRHTKDAKSYVVEDSNGKQRTREHKTLQGAVKDLASTWRGRLN
jgi:hypothetical protein